MHQTTLFRIRQRSFLVIVALSVLLSFYSFPARAAAPDTASVQFIFLVPDDPSARLEFEITYWDAGEAADCNDPTNETRFVLNNHQRAQARNLNAGAYCISHELFGEDSNNYFPGIIDCNTLDRKEHVDFDGRGAALIGAGQRIACTLEAIR